METSRSEKEVNQLATTRVKKKRKRRQRKKKLRYLRERLAETHTHSERQRIIEKIRRISPWAPVPEA
jgi:hypothetical protein